MLLIVDGRGVDPAGHFHAGDDPPENGEALAVGVALAAEIELGLAADADKEARRRRVGAGAGHGDRGVDMHQPGRVRPFERDGRELPVLRDLAALDDFDRDGLVARTRPGHRPVKDRAVVKPRVHVAQKIGCGHRGLAEGDFDGDVPHLGPDKDPGVIAALNRKGGRERRE